METLTKCEICWQIQKSKPINGFLIINQHKDSSVWELYQENVGKSEKQKKTLKTPFEN